MLTIFNRRELASFSSREEQWAACQLLRDNGISYQLRTHSRLSPAPGNLAWRNGIGDPAQGAVYLLYVRRRDYGQAAELLGLSSVR